MVDPDVLHRLEMLARLGEPDLVSRLIDMFVHDSTARMAALRTALNQDDRQTLASVAHGIAGGAGSLGLKDLAVRCLDLEACASSASLPEVQHALDEVEHAFELARA